MKEEMADTGNFWLDDSPQLTSGWIQGLLYKEAIKIEENTKPQNPQVTLAEARQLEDSGSIPGRGMTLPLETHQLKKQKITIASG